MTHSLPPSSPFPFLFFRLSCCLSLRPTLKFSPATSIRLFLAKVESVVPLAVLAICFFPLRVVKRLNLPGLFSFFSSPGLSGRRKRRGHGRRASLFSATRFFCFSFLDFQPRLLFPPTPSGSTPFFAFHESCDPCLCIMVLGLQGFRAVQCQNHVITDHHPSFFRDSLMPVVLLSGVFRQQWSRINNGDYGRYSFPLPPTPLLWIVFLSFAISFVAPPFFFPSPWTVHETLVVRVPLSLLRRDWALRIEPPPPRIGFL